MERLRSKIAGNQTALASLGAGILLCTLAAFVYIMTDDNRSDLDGSRVSAPSNVNTTMDREGWRVSQPDSAMRRVLAIESWRVVLEWALSSEENGPDKSSVETGQAVHLLEAGPEPPRWSGRGEISARLSLPVKRDADAAERLADESVKLTSEPGSDSEE